MFRRHVEGNLLAYLHGELSAGERRRVAAHLETCARCQSAEHDIRFAMGLAGSLQPVESPAGLWDGIEAALRHSAAGRAPATRRFAGLHGWRMAAAMAAVLAFAAGVWVLWINSNLRVTGPAAWEVKRVAGAPLAGGEAVGERGRLAVGEWLVTDAASRADLQVAAIGRVAVDPNTRLRLLASRETEHRLELARGRIEANITAPPRLFFVNTPSAVAVDYGCAYSLEVGDDGGARLHVTNGWVYLEAGGRSSRVPAEALCATRPNFGPGTPYFEDAGEALKAALDRFDFEGGGAAALDVVLDQARPRDSLTLWHLLSRTEGGARRRVYDRLVLLVPLPEGATPEAMLALDPSMLEAWLRKMTWVWY